MKLNKVLFGTALAVNTFYVLAAEPAPVIDVSRAKLGSSSMTISQQLASLGRKLDSRNRAQVNVQRQLDELQNEVNELRGVTELHTHQLSQVLERQRELYQELDRRVTEALKPVNKVPASLVAPKPGSDSSVNYSSNLSENEAYDRAVNLVLKDKRYEQAIPEFRAFNKKFPNSSYAANSHYWLGLLLFNKNDLTKAKIEFDIVVNDFADSNKRSEAMLKLAMVQQKKNNISQAIAQYRQLIEEYPSSSAAVLAQTRLETLTP
ncbi:MAG: tol-pal system protein YbgF [Alteromonadaceae bacterium]|nr:tol-pal system protein YbgF [Alteromonadaceae bacterium]